MNERMKLKFFTFISGKIIQTGSGSVQHRRTNSEGRNCIIGAVSIMSASIGDVVEESSANIEVNEIPRLLFGTHTPSVHGFQWSTKI